MGEGGDIMVSSDKAVTSPDSSDIVILESYPSEHDESSANTNTSEVPEYATITRRRPHEPPSYSSYKGDSSTSHGSAENDVQVEEAPEDEIGVSTVKNDEDRLLEEEPNKNGANTQFEERPEKHEANEQFENKHKGNDECIVDCLYYTTTCCECTIL